MKAYLKNNRQSPRKVRLVASLIKGKSVPAALVHLQFVPKKASSAVESLIKSAAANAKSAYNLSPESLMVKEIRVDSGLTLKRSMPRARGRAFPIKKRSSHISVTLAEISAPKVEKTKKAATPKKLNAK